MKTYKQSTKVFVLKLIVDAFFCLILIGFITFIYHVLEYLNQSITIGPKSVVLKKGILNIKTLDIRYNKINSINVDRGLLGRILGYGTILIFTGNDVSGIAFKNVDEPEMLKMEIDKMIDGDN